MHHIPAHLVKSSSFIFNHGMEGPHGSLATRACHSQLASRKFKCDQTAAQGLVLDSLGAVDESVRAACELVLMEPPVIAVATCTPITHARLLLLCSGQFRSLHLLVCTAPVSLCCT